MASIPIYCSRPAVINYTSTCFRIRLVRTAIDPATVVGRHVPLWLFLSDRFVIHIRCHARQPANLQLICVLLPLSMNHGDWSPGWLDSTYLHMDSLCHLRWLKCDQSKSEFPTHPPTTYDYIVVTIKHLCCVRVGLQTVRHFYWFPLMCFE